MFLVHWIVNWLIGALALWLVAQVIPGIQIRSFQTAMLATIVIALVDVTIGLAANAPVDRVDVLLRLPAGLGTDGPNPCSPTSTGTRH